MDFIAELKKLIDAEEAPLLDPLVELARAQSGVLENIHKNETDISLQLDPLVESVRAQASVLESIRKSEADISLQVEEIYDIVKESDENAKEVRAAAKREALLLESLVTIADLMDDVLNFLHKNRVEHTNIISAKMEEAINACGLERLGTSGEPLDPRLHTVASAQFSEIPKEHLISVLQSGYAYNGKLIRRATVIVSKGVESV